MSVSFFSMSGTTDAFAFAVGAEAFARRWAICRSGNGGVNNENSVAARWVREPCERTRACVAPGYLVFTGVVVECPAEPHETESDDDISEDEASQDDISEDEACLPPRGPLPGNRNRNAILLEYHVVFSASYMVPVLLVRGRYTAAPMKTLGFGELVETLSTVSTISAAEKKSTTESPGETAVSLFAPWEHPHGKKGTGGSLGNTTGCWVGAHPCETGHVMGLLFSGGGESDSGKETKNYDKKTSPLAYVTAWFRFASRAVPGLRMRGDGRVCV